MVITSSSGVDAAVTNASNAPAGTVASAASLSVLRTALDTQAAGAVALIAALPQAPAWPPEGHAGRHVDWCG